MDDLVKRLRERDNNRVGFFGPMPYNRDGEAAIALLEAQAALIAEAREVIVDLMRFWEPWVNDNGVRLVSFDGGPNFNADFYDRAAAVLAKLDNA